MDLWDKDFVVALGKQFKVIMFDNSGMGGSSVEAEKMSMSRLANNAVELMDHLGLPDAHILGISMGGMIAQQLAVSFPNRVAKLILGATSCSPKYIKRSFAQLGLLLIHSFPKFGMRFMVSAEFIKNNPEVIESMAAYVRKHPVKFSSLRLQAEAIRSYDLDASIASVQVPTLILVGTGDQIINPENSDIIAKKIPHSRLIKFQGVGHMFPLERRAETTEAILSFLLGPSPKL